jgi:quercetin dioxygenase-like cupin family protein
VEFLRVELDPDPSERPQLYAHEGEEYGFVIKGRAEIQIDRSTYVLGVGDSIFFHATVPHYVRSVGRTTAVMIWAISPPRY